ncbi:MAG: carboxylating nicotinate-nucleotide diphosphorylase [Pseudomonadota bacterium]|nr:carboxylating nicotinate-nucleotide diphosphorylase [Pseudomonadota bacterium]
MTTSRPPLPDRKTIAANVRATLAEDIGGGDLTAKLIPASQRVTARLVCREPAVLCGCPWFEEVFRQLDPAVVVEWRFEDGDRLSADSLVCLLHGPARPILTGERSAINLLQTLSGTATAAGAYARRLEGLRTRVLDTRKTLPGLRLAQKYAAATGGATNHRVGLFDGILIKENHIRAAGSIAAAVEQARREASPHCLLEVEVESLSELKQALAAGAPRIMLDNFDLETMRQAVTRTDHRAELEASGDVTLDNIREIAATGVDFISVGAITKHLRSIDFSMRFEDASGR